MIELDPDCHLDAEIWLPVREILLEKNIQSYGQIPIKFLNLLLSLTVPPRESQNLVQDLFLDDKNSTICCEQE